MHLLPSRLDLYIHRKKLIAVGIAILLVVVAAGALIFDIGGVRQRLTGSSLYQQIFNPDHDPSGQNANKPIPFQSQVEQTLSSSTKLAQGQVVSVDNDKGEITIAPLDAGDNTPLVVSIKPDQTVIFQSKTDNSEVFEESSLSDITPRSTVIIYGGAAEQSDTLTADGIKIQYASQPEPTSTQEVIDYFMSNPGFDIPPEMKDKK